MTQDMVKMMSQDKMIGKREILSSSPSPWFSRFLRTMLLLLMMTLGVGEMYGQGTPKVADGIYYIKHDAGDNGIWYLWPSVTTNGTTKNAYLTTSNVTSLVEAIVQGVNNNQVGYGPFNKTYSHWIVKNVDGEESTIQLINPKLNKYVVIRQKSYGDRDVWLADKPAEENISYSYFVLNLNDPYRISPYPGLNSVNTTDAYTFNSASGLDRAWLTWSEGGKDYSRSGEGRAGLIQFYNKEASDGKGKPLWSFQPDLLDAPTINDVNASSIATVDENNELLDGYNVRYTFGEGSATPEDPTASSPIMDASGFIVRKAGTLKVVIERYGVVLTGVDSKYVEPTLETCANPSISYDNTTGEVTINCTDPTDATIYYTADGTTIPSSSPEMLYSTPVSITAETTFKAVATYTGRTPSEVATETITKVETPTIVNNGTNIVISCPTDGATIYYTTADTGDPSTPYDPLNPPVASDHEGDTFRAIAKKDGCITSDASEPLMVIATCHLPVISLNWQTGEVTISNGTDDEVIYYTTDGSDPLPGFSYNGSFTISAATTVKAIATKPGMNNSSVATETFSKVETPSIQDNGSYAISITSDTEGAEIYYATGGSTPSYGTNLYVTPLNLSNVAVKAKAFKDGMVPSEEASATITLQLPTPTITLGDNNIVNFSIDPAIDGVTYKYTTDGSDPSTNGTDCEGSFTLAAPATVRVIATHTDYTNSPETSKLIIQINKDFVFQQKECEDFFLTQAKVDGDYKRLTTTNIPSADIVWHFEDANDGADQYYYIVKNNSGDDSKEYLSFESNGFCLVSADAFKQAEKDKFRFSIIENIENRTYFNFKVKGANKYVQKLNGNDATNYINAGDNPTYNKDQWKISSAPTSLDEMNALISDPQFSPFTETTPKYYYIQSVAASVNSVEGPFYITRLSDGDGHTYAKGTKDLTDKGTRWYLKEAEKTQWNTYYYLVNAETGLYMNYSVGNNGDKAGVVETKVTEDTEDKDKYKYLIVKTAKDGNYKDGYNIIPKMLESKANLEGNSMQLHHQNYSYALRANNSRGRADTKWIFVEDDKYIAPIVITQNLDAESEDYLKVTITCAENANDAYNIYYTENGSDPDVPALSAAAAPTAPTKVYLGAFLPSIDATTIKAVAVSKTDHDARSSVDSYDLPNVCETPTASFNSEHQLEITSATTGAAIYYAIGTSEPSLGENPLVINCSNGETTYTAVAARQGMKKSGALTVTVVYNPTIELTENEVAITDDTYEYDKTEHTPVVKSVKVGDSNYTNLDTKTYYTVVYSNNINAGEKTATDSPPTVTINDAVEDNLFIYGTTTFTIKKKEVGISWSNTTLYYDGSPKVPIATATGIVTGDECRVIINVDGDNATTGEGGVKTAVAIGSYTATATELSNPNYVLPSSDLIKAFEIVAAHFDLSIDGWIYGSEPNPPVISEAGDYNLDTKEIKYKAKTAADYSDEVPTNVGEYTVKVKLTKNNSEETAENTADFTITPKSLNTDPDDPTIVTCANDINIDIVRDDDGVYTVTVTDTSFDPDAVLVQDTDYGYTISDDASDSRYATVTITGVNNYKNSFRVIFAKVTFSKFYEEGSVIKKAGVFVTGSETGTNDYDKDMAIPSNMTANIVTSVNDDNTISRVSLDYIPKAVPVLLLSNVDVGNGFIVEDRNGGTDITDEQKASDLLVAQTSETPLEKGTATVYLLYKGEFVLNKAGTLPQWMVYLPKPSSGGSGARLMILDEGSTDINGILEKKNTELPYDKWFSIDGRRLNGKPTKKGLYIKNGQKAVVK